MHNDAMWAMGALSNGEWTGPIRNLVGGSPEDCSTCQDSRTFRLFLLIPPQGFQGSQDCKGHRETRDEADYLVTREITAGQE